MIVILRAATQPAVGTLLFSAGDLWAIKVNSLSECAGYNLVMFIKTAKAIEDLGPFGVLAVALSKMTP